jgi:TolB-like protein
VRHRYRVIRLTPWLAVLSLCAGMLAARPPAALGQSVQQSLETLAGNMAARLVREGAGTLALVIADFPNLRGEYCGMGRFVAERLTTQLAATKGLKVLERSTLAQALLEMKLAQADLADAEKAKQVGLRIGAQAVALGGLADLGNTVELDLRVLKLDSGETLFAGFGSFAKTQGIDALMQRDCGRGHPPATAAGGSPAIEPQENTGKAEKALSGSEPTYENTAYRLTFEAVRKTGDTVAATVVLENIGKAPIKFAVRNNSYLIDENGDRWDQVGSDSAALWAWGDSFSLPDLIPGIKRRTRLQYKAAASNSQGTVFTLVAKEYRPQEGRTVSLSGIKAERELIQPR